MYVSYASPPKGGGKWPPGAYWAEAAIVDQNDDRVRSPWPGRLSTRPAHCSVAPLMAAKGHHCPFDGGRPNGQVAPFAATGLCACGRVRSTLLAHSALAPEMALPA